MEVAGGRGGWRLRGRRAPADETGATAGSCPGRGSNAAARRGPDDRARVSSRRRAAARVRARRPPSPFLDRRPAESSRAEQPVGRRATVLGGFEGMGARPLRPVPCGAGEDRPAGTRVPWPCGSSSRGPRRSRRRPVEPPPLRVLPRPRAARRGPPPPGRRRPTRGSEESSRKNRARLATPKRPRKRAAAVASGASRARRRSTQSSAGTRRNDGPELGESLRARATALASQPAIRSSPGVHPVDPARRRASSAPARPRRPGSGRSRASTRAGKPSSQSGIQAASGTPTNGERRKATSAR